jgi:hypothetical protein
MAGEGFALESRGGGDGPVGTETSPSKLHWRRVCIARPATEKVPARPRLGPFSFNMGRSATPASARPILRAGAATR